MYNVTTAHIDLEALSNNLEKVKSSAPQSKVLAMVKCNAYGHGAVQVTKKIEKEVDAFGVMFLEEAIELYDAGIKKPIVILTGFFDKKELEAIDQYGFESVVHNLEQIDILEKTKLTKPLRVWLKIDSGMHRLGLQSHEVPFAYKSLMANETVEKPLRLMTHFADADDLASGKTKNQIEIFEKVTKNLEGELCLANSAAILNHPTTRTTWIRPGILLYGAVPFESNSGLELGLEPVMTLTSQIITTHFLAKGETIGYGSTFECPQNMRIGTAAIGYGHGYPRNVKSAPVLVDGVHTQLVGRVAMDMFGIDLRKVPEAKIGSQIILWGRGLPIEEIARNSGEIQYELFCRLTFRVKYKFYQQSFDLKL